MKFRNMTLKYMNVADDGSQGGGGGLTPPPLPPATPQPVQQPVQAPVQTPAPVQVQQPVAQPSTGTESFVVKAGMSMEHIHAELEGLGKLSEVTMGMLRKVHGEHADLIAQVIANEHANTVAVEQKNEAEAHSFIAEQFGLEAAQGSAAMTELVTWATQNLPQEELSAIADIIDGGGYGAKVALKELVSRYRSGASVTPQVVDNGAVPVVQGNVMTRAEYISQLAVLEKKHGYNSPQVITLQNQRLQAMQKGY